MPKQKVWKKRKEPPLNKKTGKRIRIGNHTTLAVSSTEDPRASDNRLWDRSPGKCDGTVSLESNPTVGRSTEPVAMRSLLHPNAEAWTTLQTAHAADLTDGDTVYTPFVTSNTLIQNSIDVGCRLYHQLGANQTVQH